MKKYIALLRGINVGGNSKISMSELKELFEQSGFQQVSTYINSGNVIFSSDITDGILLNIFWSAPIDTFSRTHWSKVVGSSVYNSITIRNSNTTKKLLELVQ